MKPTLAILISCFAMLFTISAQAGCPGYNCNMEPSYVSDGCGAGGCPGDGNPNCSSCQCTDFYATQNPCISTSEACEAFGNVGGR